MPRDSIQTTSTTTASSRARKPKPPPGPERPAPKRRRLDAASAQERILAAAETLLVDAGPDSLTLQEVAREAGISHPNVLYHFGSIAELQKRLAQRIAVRLAEEIARVFEAGLGREAPIEAAVARVFGVFQSGGYARLLAWLVLSKNEPSFGDLSDRLDIIRSLLAAHPSLRGPENEELRKRIVPSIELVIVAAIGYGLTGDVVDGFFAPNTRGPGVAKLLGELMTAAILRRNP